MPTFNGVAIFGVASKFRTGSGQRITQENESFGLNGVEVIDGGSRKQQTMVTGVLLGADVGDWSAAVALFRSYYDGNAYVLVDSKGRTWPYVRLINFDEGDMQADWTLGYFSIYTAVFEHLLAV